MGKTGVVRLFLVLFFLDDPALLERVASIFGNVGRRIRREEEKV